MPILMKQVFLFDRKQIAGDKNSVIIDSLRPFLMLLVIFNHCTGEVGGVSLFSGLLQTFLGKIITLSATSCFFLISGFLFFYRIDNINKNIINGKIKKRFYTLFLPYVLWNGLGIIALIGAKALSGKLLMEKIDLMQLLTYLWCNNQWAADHSNILGWSTAMTGPVDLPLWYLRDLIVVTLFSPFIYRLVNNYSRGRLFIVIIGVLFIFNIWIQVPGFSAQAFFFWSIGAYLAINKLPIYPNCKTSSKLVGLLIVITLLPIVTGLKYKNECVVLSDIFQRVLTIVLVFVFIALSHRLSFKKQTCQWWSLLLSSTFFVYAIHAFPVLNPIAVVRYIVKYLPSCEVIAVLSYLMTPFIVYTLSVLTYAFIKKLAPKFTAVLSGGRK